MDGCKVSQAPVFVACHSLHSLWTGASSSVATSAYYSLCWLRYQTAVQNSWKQAEWSAIRNSTWPLRAATRCPLMTQDAIQFSGDVWFGSGRFNPACFTGRRATPLSGAPSPSSLDKSGRKVSHSALSTGPKASPMPRVTLCTNAYSCWSDFWSPAYADCGCLQKKPVRVSMDSAHLVILPDSHLFFVSLSPMKPPRYRCPVTTWIPIPQKNSSTQATLRGDTKKWFLLDQGSSLLAVTMPVSPEDALGCVQNSPLPPHHLRTTVLWRKNGLPEAP